MREDILAAIPGDNPAGRNLRYDGIYDKIREARREEPDLAQGEWKRERKLAEPALVIKLAEEAIATQSKDLQLAAWLTEAMLRRGGFAGLNEGLRLCRGIIDAFWEHLFPVVEDNDLEPRAALVDWIGSNLDLPLKSVRLNREGHDFYKYTDSRSVGYEDQAKAKDQKTARDAKIKAGKLTPEAFDKAFAETPKQDYARDEKNLDLCLKEIALLDEVCNTKFGKAAPSFGRLIGAVEEVRRVVHALLQKKRETEPDPVVVDKTEKTSEITPEILPSPVESRSPETGDATELQRKEPFKEATGKPLQPMLSWTFPLSEQRPGWREAIEAVIAGAAFLRRVEPGSPAPYLMLRGLRWGELRAAIHSRNPAQLEAPPPELRRAIRMMALEGRWKDLIETAENAMGLPCSRAWLDLQRSVVEACAALEEDYQLVGLAIRSELRALIRDVPEVLDLTLTDDTPAANAETQRWLRQLAEEPQAVTPRPLPARQLKLDGESGAAWHQKFVDVYDLAVQAVKGGQEQKGFELLHTEIQRQRSGRARFEKKLQFLQLCTSTGKEALAQPLLDDLLTAIDTHKLDEWEDREKLAAALVAILNASKRIQGDPKEKQKMFERICRLDPVQALSIG